MAEVAAVSGGCLIWTREDLNLFNRMEFNNSVKVLGVADDAGSYAFLDEFGNTFRSFFIAYDNQDLSAAKDYSKTVGNQFCSKQSATNEECPFNDSSCNYSIEENDGNQHEEEHGEPEQTQEYGDENGKAEVYFLSSPEETPSDSIVSISNESSECGPASLAIEDAESAVAPTQLSQNNSTTTNNRNYNRHVQESFVNEENCTTQKQLSVGSDEKAGNNYDPVPPPNSLAFADKGDQSAALLARGMPSDCSSSSPPVQQRALVRCRRSIGRRARKNKNKKGSNRIPNGSATTAGEEQMVLPEKNLLLKDKADRATDDEGGRWRSGYTAVKPP
eukprot:gene29548-39171_t